MLSFIELFSLFIDRAKESLKTKTSLTKLFLGSTYNKQQLLILYKRLITLIYDSTYKEKKRVTIYYNKLTDQSHLRINLEQETNLFILHNELTYNFRA